MSGPLLVLGGGAGQLGALRAAARLGVEVLVCDRDPAPLALRLGLCGRVEPVSTMDEAALEALARRVGAGGLLAPGTDLPVRLAARVAARLGLPHPLDPATAERATDKRRQRAAFAAAGVPQPAYRLDGGAPPGDRVVVKAADAQGQRGLTVIDEPALLPAALAAARAAAPGGEALVEELVEGPELTVNAFHVDGAWFPLTVTDRERSAAFGVATAHVFPARAGAGVAEVARAACAALGLRDGPSYTQLVVGPDGPRVMEVAARLGGGHDAELCEAALGVDLAGLAVQAALGRRPDPEQLVATRRQAALVRFLIAPAGVLQRVEGLEAARALPGVLEALSYRAAGDRIAPLMLGADRAGSVLVAGATRPGVEATAAAAAAAIRFVVA